ncbi:PleD family two-component system response regulator [Arcobacter sp. s6]|jgi:DNA-binding response OmpR family regulator|uniref:PleD family two-component system response regulator n=1 Tax=Arcobacter sp. s6 TaxID=3230363 RepID=UPI0034A07222
MSEDKYKILVVDDEEINLQIVQINLETDYLVDTTISIKEALKLIDQNIYDAFIFDINMDEMDGLELCKVVKNYKQYIYTPVLFVTILDEVEKIEQGFENGASDYITKPVNPQELKIRLKAHIKTSKNQIELYYQQLILNEQIEKLSYELVTANKNTAINEKFFQNRETNFKYNDERIKENLKTTELFNEKILIMQNKLKNQKELLERVKSSLI